MEQKTESLESQQPQHSPVRNVLHTRKFILEVGILLVVLISAITFVVFRSSHTSQSQLPVQDKTWQITVSYNNQTDTLSFKKIILLNKKIRPNYQPAKLLPFSLLLKDKSNRTLYTTGIPVSLYIHADEPYFTSKAGVNFKPYQSPAILDSNIFIPYLESAGHIIIEKNGKTVLDISVPQKNTSLNLIPNVYAQACTSGAKTQVVVISDNYNGNYPRFHADVDAFKQLVHSTYPYSTGDYFDIQYVDNNQSIGCGSGDIYACAQNYPLAEQIGRAAYPDATYFIVISNGVSSNGARGVTLMGGDVALFFNDSTMFQKVALHESLGHLIGLLYDRYVNSNINYIHLISNSSGGVIRSNCTDNPQGENFWKAAGATAAYSGCSTPAYYSPYPLTCPGDIQNGGVYVSGGRSDTPMSVINCVNTLSFDQVEQKWIKDTILPTLNTCSGGVTPTPTASAQSYSVSGFVYVDTNNNHAKDSGEPGLQDVSIILDTPGGSRSTTSDAQGNFSFNQNLTSGNYSSSKIIIHGQTVNFSSPLTFTLSPQSPFATFSVPISPQLLNAPTPTLASQIPPTPTSSSSQGNPDSGGTSGGSSLGGGEDQITPEQPVVLYNCHTVSSQNVGSSLSVSYLQCDPIQQ